MKYLSGLLTKGTKSVAESLEIIDGVVDKVVYMVLRLVVERIHLFKYKL